MPDLSGPDLSGPNFSGLDLSPAPAPAPPAKRIIRHGLIEARLLIRNGEQLLLALVIPLAILVAGRFAGASIGSLDLLGPSVLALAVWSSAFTSVAISTAFERRYGVLERLATTPLGKPGLLAGKALAVILIMLGQLVILAGAALALGWRPEFTPSLSAAGGGPGDLGHGDVRVPRAAARGSASSRVDTGPCQSDLRDLAHRRSTHHSS